MAPFHEEMFARRASMSFADKTSFGPAPRPLFGEAPVEQREFAFEPECEVCEGCVRRGIEVHVHVHRVVCRGVQQGCCCHCCCAKRRGCGDSGSSNGHRSRTEQSETDSQFGMGRVRAWSSTTMTGDADFGFANMDSEMLRMAADNRWRSGASDSFYRPLGPGAPMPHGHVPLREGNVGQVFGAHHMMHASRQQHMHAQAADHFAGHGRPMPLFGRYDAQHQQQEEESKVKVTTTTTTTTKTTRREIPCEEEKVVVVHKPAALPPPPPPPPTEHHHHHHHHAEKDQHHHHHHHHSAVPAIPVGVRPDIPAPKAEACCTWCKFLPCFACPTPANPNERFRKANFRLYPEYEFLPDDVAVAKATEYFPEHTQVPSRTTFKVTVPKVTEVAQRVFVDFIGDQMVIIGEHGHGASNVLTRRRSSPSVGSTRSAHPRHGSTHHHHGAPPPHHHQAVRVFAKNFFVPRDTYDRNRAQAFVKPNGKLKVVVPVLPTA